jgi:ubiquinone/menaquinone biosynthesis C-methylase UbiE
MNKDFIREFWDNQANQFESHHSASWGDKFAIDLEIENIAKYIKNGSTVLDVGCANGYSTFRQLECSPKYITGIDFSEPMIKFANEQKKKAGIKNVDFFIGDIRNIQYSDESFDITYTTRVLINLPNWQEQIKGINECLRVTKKGGKVIFSEAFYEPLVLLNALRALKNLSPLEEHDFNRYLKKEKLEKYLSERKYKFEMVDFSSVYYLGSRFLRDLVTTIDNYPGYTNPVNKIFYDIEKEFSGGGFGIQVAYVIEK